VRQQAEGILAAAEEQTAVKENLFDAARAARRAALTRSGAMRGRGSVEMRLWGLADLLGLEGLVMREQLQTERLGRDNFSPELERQLSDYLKRSTRSLESIDKKTVPQRGVPVAPGVQE
jgi:hypothetical protein